MSVRSCGFKSHRSHQENHPIGVVFLLGASDGTGIAHRLRFFVRLLFQILAEQIDLLAGKAFPLIEGHRAGIGVLSQQLYPQTAPRPHHRFQFRQGGPATASAAKRFSDKEVIEKQHFSMCPYTVKYHCVHEANGLSVVFDHEQQVGALRLRQNGAEYLGDR